MRSASPQLIAYLNSIRSAQQRASMIMPDCFRFDFLNGTSAYFTNADELVKGGDGNNYIGNSILVDGLRYSSAIGTDVDKQSITLSANGTMTINGVPWLTAIKNGLLDGCFISRYRVFLASWSITDRMNPIGSVLLFKGRVGTVDQVGRTTAKISVNSDLVLLDMQMPRNLYSPSCVHVLYDSGCGLDRDDFKYTGNVGAGSTDSVINWASASANFTQGRLIFTSGVNAGISCNVKVATTTQLTISYPLDTAPDTGDAFEVYYGCDHTMATCTAKFNNLVNFRGFPFIPPPTWGI